MTRTEFKTIDEYIDTFPQNIQDILRRLRQTIREAAPDAEETISYQMPTFRANGNLVHFAAYKEHIGFYPEPSGIAEFKKDLSAYGGGKGTVRFPLDEPIPFDLIRRIVKFRVKENLARAQAKGKKENRAHSHPKASQSRWSSHVNPPTGATRFYDYTHYNSRDILNVTAL
jgi:uncharacterized protein YdhG (YjbR/CyaY superfamily)